MKKFLSVIAVLMCLVMALSLTACKGNENVDSTPSNSTAKAEVTVACMTGPTGMGMAKLMAENEEGKTQNSYTFDVQAAATDILPRFIKGEVNIASVPTNVAATVYKQTGGKVRILAVNTYGVLSILEKGNTIDSVDDLKGKTVYSTGKGQNPEFILKYILTENGIDPEKDLTLEFVSSDDLKAKLISGEAEVAMAPEPLATAVMVQNKELNRVLSINDEWSKVSENQLMMGCVIALDSYISENKDAVEKFLKEYEASIKFALENPDAAASSCAKYGISPSEAIAKKSLPTCNLCYVTGETMKNSVKAYYSVLFNADPTSVGGALPADDFYYNAE